MARTIPATLTSELVKEQNAPVELYELYLDDQTYYYANAEQDIILAAQTYTALAIKRGRVGTHMDSKVDEISVSFDNTDRSFSILFQSTDFQGRILIIKKVFRNLLDDATNFIKIFEGRMDGINISSQFFSIRVVSLLDAIMKLYPGRVFQKTCNYKFGNTACDIEITDSTNKQTGTATNASTATIIKTTDLDQIDDYWNIGYLKIVAGTNNGLSRPIDDFVAGATAEISVRLPFPVACDDTSQFEIYRGCNKTETDCIDKFNNQLNYGGFTTIPKKPIT